MRVQLLATQPGLALYQVVGSDTAVVVDTDDMNAFDPVPVSVATAQSGWTTPPAKFSVPKAWNDLAEGAAAELNVTPAPAAKKIQNRTYRAPNKVTAEIVRGLSLYKVRGTALSVDEPILSLATRLSSGECVTAEELGVFSKAYSDGLGTKPSGRAFSGSNIAYLLTGGTPGREWVQRVVEQSAELAVPTQAAPAPKTPPVPAPDSSAPAAAAPARQTPTTADFGKQTTDPTDTNGWVDISKPHNFMADSDDPTVCGVCGTAQDDQLHNPDAVAAFQKQLDEAANSQTPAEAPVTAAGFEYDPSNTYFGKMAGGDLLDGVKFDGPADGTTDEAPPGADDAMEADDDSSTAIGVTTLYMKTPDGQWSEYQDGTWQPVDAPDANNDELVELDQESAGSLADAMCGGDGDPEDATDGGSDEDTEDASGSPAPVKKMANGVYALRVTEEQLFKAAEPFLDLDLYDRVFAAVPYVDPAIRSRNAQQQPRQNGGRFGQSSKASPSATPSSSAGGGGADGYGGVPTGSGNGSGEAGGVDQDGTPTPVARLSAEHEILTDTAGRINDYLQQAQDAVPAVPSTPDASTVTAAGPADPSLAPPTVDSPDATTPATAPSSDTSPVDGGEGPDSSATAPLYLAEVDPNDTQAVLKLLAVIPASDGSQVECYQRQGANWESDADDLAQLQGVAPPPVVEIDDPTELQDVLAQISGGDTGDSSGATDTGDTTAAPVAAAGIVAAYLPNGEIAFATLTTHEIDDAGALTASQSQGAVLLSAYGDETTWPADVTARLSEFVGGVEASPKDVQNTERLRQYWTHGAGGAKVRWGQPGDWQRCVDHLGKFLGTRAKGYCTLRHHDATGFYPGHAPTEQRPHAASAVEAGTEQWLDNGAFSYKPQERRAMAKTGEALTDGSFPIRNKPDLDKAIQQFVELEVEQRPVVRKHIDKRAMALGIADSIPQEWKDAAALDLFEQGLTEALTAAISAPIDGDIEASRAILEMPFAADELEALGLSEFKTFSPDQRKKMAKSGTALPDGSFPIKGKADVGRAVQAYGRAKDKAKAKKHIIKRAKAVGATGTLPDSWAGYASNELADAPVDDTQAPQTVDDVKTGARFRIPLLVPEGVSSGDGRTFTENSVTSRDTPLALMWQKESDDGHKRSVIVGRIDHIERIPQGIGNCYGVFDTGIEGQEAERMVRSGMLRGVSADLDEFEAQVHEPENEDTVTSTKLTVNKGRVMGATLVAKPAFPDVVIELIDEGDDVDEYSESTPAVAAAALVAAAAPISPPGGWFEDPKLSGPTPLTVDDEGRVYGHIALWDVDHIGLPFGTRAPKSLSNYAYFRTGVVRAQEGSDIPVGQLTLSGGHAPLSMTASDAVRHYDDTNSAVADVAAGEDKHGIWVAGALRPEVTPEQVRAFRASASSGDWRPIRGKLELVAVCQVNVPGFPVARARVASGMVQALVAAGSAPLLDMKLESMAASAALSDRVAALETATKRSLQAEAEAAKARVLPTMDAHRQALIAAADVAREKVNARRMELSVAAEEVRSRFNALRPTELAPGDPGMPDPALAPTDGMDTPTPTAPPTAVADAGGSQITVTGADQITASKDGVTIQVVLPQGMAASAVAEAIAAALEVVPPFDQRSTLEERTDDLLTSSPS